MTPSIIFGAILVGIIMGFALGFVLASWMSDERKRDYLEDCKKYQQLRKDKLPSFGE